jgi:hypothetical protein
VLIRELVVREEVLAAEGLEDLVVRLGESAGDLLDDAAGLRGDRVRALGDGLALLLGRKGENGSQQTV